MRVIKKLAYLSISAVMLNAPATLAQTGDPILDYRKKTFTLLNDGCSIELLPDVPMQTQQSDCIALIGKLKQERAGFQGDGLQATQKWADQHLNWNISLTYAHLALKYIAAEQTLSANSCGYAISWKNYIDKIKPEYENIAADFETMKTTAYAVKDQCAANGYTTILE